MTETAPTRGRLTDQRYRSLADAMPQMVWATDASGRHYYFNRRWYEYTGLSEAESIGFGFANALHPDDRPRTLERWERAWRDGESYEIEYRFRRHDGAYQWFIGRAEPVRDDAGQIVEWVGTCTNIDDQKRLFDTQAFLAAASKMLADSLDYEETLAHVAELAVPHIADWCAIDMWDGGQLQRLGVAHVDPAKVELAWSLNRRYPFDPSARTGVAEVLRTGRSELVSEIPEELIRSSVGDPELLEIMLGLGLKSSMVVPLVARGRTLGAITMVAAESGRRFNEVDLQLAEDLARRAAVAVDNAELYRELRRFRETLDSTADCVFMFDPQTLRFFYVNRGAVEQVGYPREELLGMTPLDIKPEFTVASFRAMVAPLLSGAQSSHTFQTVHRHKDGHDVPVEIVLQYVAPPDEEGRFVAVVRDVTERTRAEAALRASEQRYRELADAMPQFVWTSNASGSVDYLNRQWYEFTGMDVEASLHDGWRDAIHPEDATRVAEHRGRAIAAGQPYEMEVRMRRADGRYLWHLVRVRPVRDAAGPVSYWVGTATDIDGQKRTEEALQERGEELTRTAAALEARNRELDQFAYVTSHDLKAPLRGISNLAQWVEEDLGDAVTEEARRHLELLRGRVARMDGLIDGILTYSRVGRMGGAIERVDVGALVTEVVDLLAPGADARVEVAPGLPTIWSERLPLQQVFQNLIGNALKHGGADVRVTVTCQRRDRAYEFAVSDSGPGIAPQYHERIFGIFQTLASRDKTEGSGLGLALVKKIVESKRGRVWLESAPGRGATFFFTWPQEQLPAQR